MLAGVPPEHTRAWSRCASREEADEKSTMLPGPASRVSRSAARPARTALDRFGVTSAVP